jgi:hypothetical protein
VCAGVRQPFHGSSLAQFGQEGLQGNGLLMFAPNL